MGEAFDVRADADAGDAQRERVVQAFKRTIEGALVTLAVAPHLDDSADHSKTGVSYHSKDTHDHSKTSIRAREANEPVNSADYAEFTRRVSSLRAFLSEQ